ncbi:MAG: hypothetical protein ACOYKN_16645 [Pirellula sp.]
MPFNKDQEKKIEEIFERAPAFDDRDTRVAFIKEVFGNHQRFSAIAGLADKSGRSDFGTFVLNNIATIADEALENRFYQALKKRIQNEQDQRWIEEQLGGLSQESLDVFRSSDLILNPYLIDQNLIPRDEEKELDQWLMRNPDPEDRFLCITDFGGAGKTALVWRWLNSPAVERWRYSNRCQLFWSTFYARDYSALDFLRKIAIQLQINCVNQYGNPLGGSIADSSEFTSAWTIVIDAIIQCLSDPERGRWLFVLDGLEREMGMYADPARQIYNSEDQEIQKEKDQRNQDRIHHPDYRIRSELFQLFLSKLVESPVRMICTSRLLPNNIPIRKRIEVGFRELALKPLDVDSLWNSVTQELQPDLDAKRFFAQVGNHPQMIAIVAAAYRSSGQGSFVDWVTSLGTDPKDFYARIDPLSYVTERRHRWLDLATSDLTKKTVHWGLLCRVACSPGESSVKSLGETARSLSVGQEKWTPEKTKEVLDELKQRRLLGIGKHASNAYPTDTSSLDSGSVEFVDIHPVVRCHVYQYALGLRKRSSKDYTQNERLISKLLDETQVGSSLFLGMLDLRNIDEKLAEYQDRSDSGNSDAEGASNYDRIWNDCFAKFYPKDNQDNRSLELRMRMPALRLRRNQGYISLRSAHLFTVTGRWQESLHAYQLAEMAYAMAGDFESAAETRRARTWQQLYGGSLFEFENYFVARHREKVRWNPESDPLWLAIVLAIREHTETAPLLDVLEKYYKSEGQTWSRWHAQTLAECWYYLAKNKDDYNRPIEIIQQLPPTDSDSDFVQRVWESLTIGMCHLERGEIDQAKRFLLASYEDARKKNDAVTLGFSQTYLIEVQAMEIEQKVKESGVTKEQLAGMLDRVKQDFEKYGRKDPGNQFQIPATIANIGRARALLAVSGSNEIRLDEARKHVLEAIRIATGVHSGFCFGLGLRKASALLAEIDKKNPSIQPQKGVSGSVNNDRQQGSYEIDSHLLSLSGALEAIHGTMAVSETEEST